MYELKDDSYKTDHFVGAGHTAVLYYVFETDECGDLNSYSFETKDEAEEYIDSTNNKCVLLSVEYQGGGAFRVFTTDHT